LDYIEHRRGIACANTGLKITFFRQSATNTAQVLAKRNNILQESVGKLASIVVFVKSVSCPASFPTFVTEGHRFGQTGSRKGVFAVANNMVIVW